MRGTAAAAGGGGVCVCVCAEEALETFEKAVYIVEQIYGAGNHPDWAMTVAPRA